MRLWWKLTWRDLIRNPRFALLFVLNLALGLTGFLLIGSFAASLDRHLADHLKEMLTADLVVRSARPLSELESDRIRAAAGAGSRHALQISFYSMVKGGRGARLAQIVAVDAAYPLYGKLHHVGTADHRQVIDSLQHQPELLMTRETAEALETEPGATLTIGQAAYRAAHLLEREPAAEFSAFDLAPTIYMGLPQVESSGLIRFGSRVRHSHFVRLPEGVDAGSVAAGLTAALTGEGDRDTGIRVATTTDVNRRLGQTVGYFRTFLGLAGLVSLFLAGIAAAYLFRQHLHARMKETAILQSLGASRPHCLGLHAGKLALLGTAATLLAVLLTWLGLPLFALPFRGLVPGDLQLTVDPASTAIALLVGTLGSLLFCLPVYLRLFSLRPLYLLQGNLPVEANGANGWPALTLSLLPALVLLFALAAVEGGSVVIGAIFTAGLVGLVLVFSLLGLLLLALCRRWAATGGVTVRIVLRNLYRNRLPAISLFVATATAMLLAGLIPQVERGLLTEIGEPEGLEMPALFLVDIQEEQQQPLTEFFRDSGAQISQPAPMVRGRIARVNGEPFARWRKQHPDEPGLSRRTEFNFSSRKQLDASETIVQGEPMNAEPWNGEGLFAISMEEQFGKRLGVGIDDRLVFDVQGIELEGRVVNLRKVRWNSFQPNFFMLLQPGVLDEAPKTYLASVSRVAPGEKQALIRRLATAFANISVIDVSRLVEQLRQITLRLTGSLRFMAALAMATGLVAVFAIARQETLRREREINLLRVLGAGIGRVRTLTMLEFGLVGGAAALSALALSTGVSYGVAWLLFDRIWRFNLGAGLLMLVAATLVSAFTALVAADSVIRRKPTALLG